MKHRRTTLGDVMTEELDLVIARQNQLLGALAVQLAVLSWMSINTEAKSISVAEELGRILAVTVNKVREHGV
jgi:hypothetical protein